MGHIKKKEAEVVDGVLELLHNQKLEEVTKRDELRCNVRNRIITAITGKSNPDVCNGSREVSLNQMVKKVLIKELVVYEPPVVYEPVLSE